MDIILSNTAAFAVHPAQAILGVAISLLCSFPIPRNRLNIVLADSAGKTIRTLLANKPRSYEKVRLVYRLTGTATTQPAGKQPEPKPKPKPPKKPPTVRPAPTTKPAQPGRRRRKVERLQRIPVPPVQIDRLRN